MSAITPERIVALVPMLQAQGVSTSARNTVVAEKTKLAAALDAYGRTGELGELHAIGDRLQAAFDPPQTGRRAVALLAKELISPEAALGVGLTSAACALAQRPEDWSAPLHEIRGAWADAIASHYHFDLRRVSEHQPNLGNYKYSATWAQDVRARGCADGTLPEPDAAAKARFAERRESGEPERVAAATVKTLCSLLQLEGCCASVDVHQLHAVFADDKIVDEVRKALGHAAVSIDPDDLIATLHRELRMPAPVTWNSISDDRIRMHVPMHGKTGEWIVPSSIWRDSIVDRVKTFWPHASHTVAHAFADRLLAVLGADSSRTVSADTIHHAIFEGRDSVEQVMRAFALDGRTPEALLVNDRLKTPVPATWPGYLARVTEKPTAPGAPWSFGLHRTEEMLGDLVEQGNPKAPGRTVARKVLEALGVRDFGWNATVTSDELGNLAGGSMRTAVNRVLRAHKVGLDAEDLLTIVCGHADPPFRFADLDVWEPMR